MEHPDRKVALSFLAHPDDAEILCAGTLARLADAGWKVHIVTATAGDCGSMTLPPARIARIRMAEARRAAAMIGGRYHCLGERDVLVVFDKPTVRKTIDLFRRIAPTLVFTHPADDYMMDHQQVHLLARAATFAYGAPNASRLPLAAGSRIPHLYYCDPVEGVNSLGDPVTPTTLIDIADRQELKLKMLACHDSQRAWLRAHHGMDEYIDAVRRHDAARGTLLGSAAGEAFVQHRGHAYPADDLLAALFPRDSISARRRQAGRRPKEK